MDFKRGQFVKIQVKSEKMSWSYILINAFLLVSCSAGMQINGGTQRLSHTKSELFGMKTNYVNARTFLSKAVEDLPNSFDEVDLESRHNSLKEAGCKPQVFYFIGRHSAKFPNAKEIQTFNSDLYELIGKMSSTTSAKFVNWKSKMNVSHDYLITDLGAREERDIARRFKRLYPEFFDALQADVQIGVTKKIRTAQTGAQFLHEISSLNMTECDEHTVPTNDLEDPEYDLSSVLGARCYSNMIDKFERPFVNFPKMCSKIRGNKKKVKDPRLERLSNPRLRQAIADKVARKLGLDNRGGSPPITLRVLESIIDMCRYESGLLGSSVWCDLLDKPDVEAIEYIEDFKSYIKTAYGPEAKVRQSCPLVIDLLQAMEEGMRLGANAKRKSYLYFTHGAALKRLLATFGMFRDDDSYSERRLEEFELSLEVPAKRSWRTSVLTPFSANLAFILYKCGESSSPQDFKILATVTERPVKLGGCEGTVCNSQLFFNSYNSLRQCDMNEICG